MTKARNKVELLEAIVAHFTESLRKGKRPSIARYQRRYPDLHDEIEELLSSVAMIEELKESPVTIGNGSLRRHMDELTDLQSIGDYEIIRELGRGGMGVVFQAVHRSLGRKVAIKVIPSGAIENDKYVARFRREARAAAKLHHTNIVSVFGVGEDDGLHYYVMEYVDGQNLADALKSMRAHPNADTSTTIDDPTHGLDATRLEIVPPPEPLSESSIEAIAETPDSEFAIRIETDSKIGEPAPALFRKSSDRFRWAARVGAQIADALSYAHTQGILHRDVKPSNMILDKEGRVWITDFGLVKDVTHHALTKTGEIIGTPQYMPPEAFEGEYDHRSETYCLGLTLYELVTLEPAFGETTTPELIRSILTTTPLPPKKLNTKIPGDLDTIIRKAIEREPGQRYQSVRELRDDLRAFLDDRAISARKPSAMGQAVRWSRRNPLAASLAGLSALLLIVASIASTLGYVATNSALNESRMFAKDLEAKKGELERAYEVADTERKAAIAAANTAKEQTERAHREFERAEANVKLMLQALDETFSYVASRGDSRPGLRIDAFHDLAGLERVISDEDAAFLNQMLEYYERFAEKNKNDAALMLEAAKAYRRVANICQLIGDVDQSLNAYKNSIRIYKEQLAQRPESIELAAMLVRTSNELALASRRSRLGSEMRTAIQDSIKTLASHPRKNSPELRLEFAKTLNLHGGMTAMSTVGNTTTFPNPSRGMGMWNRGNRSSDVAGRKPAQSGQSIKLDQREAIEIIEQLLKSDPDNTELKIELAKSYCFRAAYLFADEHDKSLGFLMQGIEHFEELKRANPENAEIMYSLALAYAMPPVDSIDKGRIWLVRATNLINELADNNPKFLEYRILQVMITCKAAGQMVVDGKYKDAEKLLDKTVEEVKEYAAAAGRTQAYPRMNMMLMAMYEVLARELREQDRRREAWAISAKARKLRPSRPSNRDNPMRDSYRVRDK